jgi:hypothetical protein
MSKIEILVTKFDSFDLEPPPPPEVGKRGFFSNDLRLDRYDNRTPGNGRNDLPQDPARRLAGTHSGSVTPLRIACANDRFYPAGSVVLEYEGTYRFNAVPNTPLEKGQVTARGVAIFDANGDPFEPPITFAITGGAEAYESARGQIVEGVPNADDRLLKIEI